MLLRISAMLVLFSILNFGGANIAFAAGGNDKKLTKKERKLQKKERKIQRKAAKVKAGVIRLGVGKESRVAIQKRDKTKLKGHLSVITDDGFEVTEKDGSSHFVRYDDTKGIKGNNLHAGVWIGIGVGIALIVIWSIFTSQLD